MAEILFRFLVPSLLEVEISISVALILLAILFFLGKNTSPLNPTRAIAPSDEKIHQTNLPAEESQETSYVIKLELLSVKYLIGANLNGTSEPYAIIKCGEQKRFSSLVPSSRNPLWGEEFLFFVNSLPVQINITIYDWDTVCKCKLLGSVILPVVKEGQSGAIWHDFDSQSGQGHMARDCQGGGGGGGYSRGGGGGGGGGDRSCYNCGEGGHIARDCPSK